MKRTTARRLHKWLGIGVCFFTLMFSLSGIILNHRAAVAEVSVDRRWLPAHYRYTAWNGGLLRGTVACTFSNDATGILLYGDGGVWRTDTTGTSFADFNKGLPHGADYRHIRNAVQTPDGSLFAVSILGLFRHAGKAGWQPVALSETDGELLTDAACHGDTLLVAGRSFLYVSVAPYASFRKIQLAAPAGFRNDVSLFRTVWLLHSGALFGLPGKLLADAVAGVLVLLCLTGLLYWLLPMRLRRRHRKGRRAPATAALTRTTLRWHDKAGRATIALTLLLTVTGWCLRPPVLIGLAQARVPAPPGTALRSDNPWDDKLRAIRRDDRCGDWLLSTSEGFYALKGPDATPVPVNAAPPVSVMGVNVLQTNEAGQWLCGSFSGLYVWDRQQGTVTDYFTGRPAGRRAGPPFGKRAVAGFSRDFRGREMVVEYDGGTADLPQPAGFETLPMSLWNVALEVHNGRIYMGFAATYVFVFIMGLAIAGCLWSGWRVRRRSRGAKAPAAAATD